LTIALLRIDTDVQPMEHAFQNMHFVTVTMTVGMVLTKKIVVSHHERKLKTIAVNDMESLL